MRFTFAILFSLLFFSQNAFSQDYSKMSANEKAKVIIYGDLYPYSLLLESGSDTLSVYEPYTKRTVELFFNDGKLIQVIEEKDTVIYSYENNRIVDYKTIHEDNPPFFYSPIYREDSLIAIPYYSVPYYPMPIAYSGDERTNTLCSNPKELYLECVLYRKNIIYQQEMKWTFYKNKITYENLPNPHFEEKVDIQMNTFFIKDNYVHIIKENTLTQEGYENEYCLTDFLMTEKHELRLKILKSPKDKPVREKSMTIDEFLNKK